MKRTLQKPMFGEVLFNGSRFIFWCLGPMFLLVAPCIAIIAYTCFADGHFLMGAVCLAAALSCLCFFLMLLDGKRFWWAGRVVSASVFGTYVWYLFDTWVTRQQPLEIGGSRSEATPWNALVGLVIIGWPCVCYTFLGRFALRSSTRQDESPFDDENQP